MDGGHPPRGESARVRRGNALHDRLQPRARSDAPTGVSAACSPRSRDHRRKSSASDACSRCATSAHDPSSKRGRPSRRARRRRRSCRSTPKTFRSRCSTCSTTTGSTCGSPACGNAGGRCDQPGDDRPRRRSGGSGRMADSRSAETPKRCTSSSISARAFPTCRPARGRTRRTQALCVPIPSNIAHRPSGVLVAGVSPRRALRRAVRGLLRARRATGLDGRGERAGVRGRATARRGARRVGPREDGVLLERESRVPHAAHADARSRAGNARRRARSRRPTASVSR